MDMWHGIALLIIAVMAYYLYALRSRMREDEIESNRLSRELEQEQIKVYDLSNELLSQKNAFKMVLECVEREMGVNTSHLHEAIWSAGYDYSAEFREYQGTLHVRQKDLRKELVAGNRQELVDRLRELHSAMGHKDSRFDEFMLELTTSPQAAANRLIVNIVKPEFAKWSEHRDC